MAARLCLVVMLCLLSSCYAGLMQLEHPQQAFCEADFGEYITDLFKILRNNGQLGVVIRRIRSVY